jgi:hypothetical protein
MASHRTAQGRAGRAFLGLENLEDRCCPTTLSLQGHTLLIKGDSHNDVIAVSDAGNGNVSASITSQGAAKALKANGVQIIEIQTGTGNDRVDYKLTGPMTTSRDLVVDLGSGFDQASLNFAKGVSAPKLNVTINGGKGSDEVDVVFGAIKGTDLNFNANLGAGNDHLFAALGDVSGAARVTLNVNNGAGFDGTLVEMQGRIGAAAQVAVNVHGGSASDTLHVDYDGQLDGKLDIHVTGGPGDDLVASDVNLAAGSKGDLKDHVDGGAGDDLLVLRVKGAKGKMHSISTKVDGGGGDNVCLHTPGVQVVHCENS